MPKISYSETKGLKQVSGEGIDLVTGFTAGKGPQVRFPVETHTGSATLTPSEDQSGAVFTITQAAGVKVRLPACAKGLSFEFHVGESFVSKSADHLGDFEVYADSSSDTFEGAVLFVSGGHAGSAVALNENITDLGWAVPSAKDWKFQVLTGQAVTSSAHRTNLGGGTSGSQGGDSTVTLFSGSVVRFVGLSDSKWLLDGIMISSGSLSGSYFHQ